MSTLMATGELVQEASAVRPGRWRLSALKRVPILPLGLIAVMVFSALFAEFLPPYSPVNISLPDRLLPPFWEAGGEPGASIGDRSSGPRSLDAHDLWWAGVPDDWPARSAG